MTITPEQEQKICELHIAGCSVKAISCYICLDKYKVYTVLNARTAIEKLSLSKLKRILKMLASEVPIGDIEIRTKTPNKYIRAIKGLYRLRGKSLDDGEPFTCPACGSIVSRIDVAREVVYSTLRFSDSYTWSQIKELYDIARDITNLDATCVITHPLFHSLSIRAKAVLGEINAES